MVAYNKFEGFVGHLGLKLVDLNVDLINIYLSNVSPSASADDVKTNLAEITQENGYDNDEDVTNTYSEASGTGTLAGSDITITASSGSFGPFQYVVMFDDTVASPVDILIAWWDYGSALTINDGESFTVDFGASIATIA